jgi:hypothetical protein
MRYALAVVVAVLELGCVKGPKGDPGPAASSGKRLVWVDATGAEVGPAAAAGVSSGLASYVDDRGLIWPVDPETARVAEDRFPGFSKLFETSDCTGTAYMVPVAPRVVFKAPGDPKLRVRPDSLASKSVSVHTLSGTDCSPTSTDYQVIDLTTTAPSPELTIPALAFAPPLRQEWH